MNNFTISVPEYFKKFINKDIDLNITNKICCPFHKENTPSFSYNTETGRWRCFGACKTGGDVIDLHRSNYKLRSRKEAEESLYKVLGINYNKHKDIQSISNDFNVILDEESIENNRVYDLCVLYANTIDRYLQFDYAMSIYPLDFQRLKDLLKEWGVDYGS